MYSKQNSRDIYKCPKCETFVAHGDKYCRFCGNEFRAEDVEFMKNKLSISFWHHGMVYNMLDTYKCKKCSRYIARDNIFCRYCGDKVPSYIEDSSKHGSNIYGVGDALFYSVLVMVLIIAIYTMI